MTNDEIEELKNQDGSFNDQVQAIFHGTAALEKFAAEFVRPRVDSLISPTDFEIALRGIFYRSLAWAQSLIVLNRNIHFQAVAAASRTVFELLVDTKELRDAPASVDKYLDYTFVERFRVAANTVSYYDSLGDSAAAQIEREFIQDPERIVRYDAVRLKHWGVDKNKNIISPKNNWQNRNLRNRTDVLGGRMQLRYRDAYSRASWFIHGDMTSVLNISPLGIQAIFGWSHVQFQECFAEILEDVCDSCHLFEADPQLAGQLKIAKLIPGKSLVQALVLEKQKKGVARG